MLGSGRLAEGDVLKSNVLHFFEQIRQIAAVSHGRTSEDAHFSSEER
jgi:hypothetical protein